MSQTALPYLVRVTLDGRVIARSRAAVRIEVHGEAPEIWLPRVDVDTDALGTSTELWRAGTGDLAEYVSFERDSDMVRVELLQGTDDGDQHDPLPQLG